MDRIRVTQFRARCVCTHAGECKDGDLEPLISISTNLQELSSSTCFFLSLSLSLSLTPEYFLFVTL